MPVAFPQVAVTASGNAVAGLIGECVTREHTLRDQVIDRGVHTVDERCLAIGAPVPTPREDDGAGAVGLWRSVQPEPRRQGASLEFCQHFRKDLALGDRAGLVTDGCDELDGHGSWD